MKNYNKIENSLIKKNNIKMDLNYPKEWEEVFNNPKIKLELDDIFQILEENEKFYGPSFPPKHLIFKSFEMVPLNKVRIVIIGQDPYPDIVADGTPRALGYAFGSKRGIPLPSSLHNIYKELQMSIPGFIKPSHGELDEWCKQGILLLNLSLTFQPMKPKSQQNTWVGFIQKLLNIILQNNPKTIFVLWGSKAYDSLIDVVGEGKHVLFAPHPSGRSAHKGFIGCNHFNKINELLKSIGENPINWQLTPH